MVCFPSALPLFAFTHIIYLFGTGLIEINVFWMGSYCLIPTGPQWDFFHLCQLLCKVSQPNLCFLYVSRNQNKTQQSTKYLLGSFSIFQIFAGLSKLYLPLSAPSKIPFFPFPLRMLMVRAFGMLAVSSAQPSPAAALFLVRVYRCSSNVFSLKFS